MESGPNWLECVDTELLFHGIHRIFLLQIMNEEIDLSRIRNILKYKFIQNPLKNHSLAQIVLSNMLSKRLPDYTSLCLFKHVKMSWSLYLDFLPFLYESIFQQKTL